MTDSGGWQDFATAPQDGTVIQARIPGHGEDNVISWIEGAQYDSNGDECGAWAFEMAKKPEKGSPCEACGKPVEVGQFVHLYDDVGEVHVDCDAPYAVTTEQHALLLLGDPMKLVRYVEQSQ